MSQSWAVRKRKLLHIWRKSGNDSVCKWMRWWNTTGPLWTQRPCKHFHTKWTLFCTETRIYGYIGAWMGDATSKLIDNHILKILTGLQLEEKRKLTGRKVTYIVCYPSSRDRKRTRTWVTNEPNWMKALPPKVMRLQPKLTGKKQLILSLFHTEEQLSQSYLQLLFWFLQENSNKMSVTTFNRLPGP